MRTLYSAGVLDAFLEDGYDDFDLYIGVSAGSIVLSSHLAGQLGRYLRLMAEPDMLSGFKGLIHYFSGGDLIDLEMLWQSSQLIEALDLEAIEKHLLGKKRFLVMAFDVDNGSSVALEPSIESMASILKCSCAIPLLVRQPICHNDRRYLDGGIKSSIPIKEAVENGATEIVVIRTQDAGYRKSGALEKWLASWIYRSLPEVKQALIYRGPSYNNQVELCLNPPRGVSIEQIQPQHPTLCGRATTNQKSILADYARGLIDGRKWLHNLKKGSKSSTGFSFDKKDQNICT
jgi:predicted patatin/cPLA2 family phospholipase